MNCQHCNGIGHTAIIGDNDLICPTCDGTGEKPVTTIQDFNNHGYLHFRATNQSVFDTQGRKIVHCSVNLRTGSYSVLRSWVEGEFLKRDVIVVTGDYPVTVKSKEEVTVS